MNVRRSQRRSCLCVCMNEREWERERSKCVCACVREWKNIVSEFVCLFKSVCVFKVKNMKRVRLKKIIFLCLAFSTYFLVRMFSFCRYSCHRCHRCRCCYRCPRCRRRCCRRWYWSNNWRWHYYKKNARNIWSHWWPFYASLAASTKSNLSFGPM